MQTTTPPLTRGVLHPELRKLVDTNELDFTQITQRIYATPVTSGGLPALKNVIDSGAFYNLNGATANPVYLNAIASSYMIVSGANDTVLSSIIMAGGTLAAIQIGALIGTAPSNQWTGIGTNMFSHSELLDFSSLLTATYLEIFLNFPIYVNTIDEADKICFDIATNANKQGILSDVTVMKAVYFLAIKPYVRTLFVGSFVEYARPNVSVYDKRNSELLLVTGVSQGIFRVVDELVKLPNPIYLNDVLLSDKLMQIFVALIIDFYINEDIVVGDKALTQIYDKISNLSNENAALKKYVEETNATLEMRKQDAITMNQHKALDEKRKSKSKTIFYLWIATLIIVLLVGGILLIKGSYKSLMIHNIVILCVILLIVLFGYIMSKIR
jgi:hypothetical protein